jgi:hypothetical protein
VSFAVLAENFSEACIRLIAVGLEARGNHSPTTKRHDDPFQWGIGLQTDDDLAIFIDVAGSVRQDA